MILVYVDLSQRGLSGLKNPLSVFSVRKEVRAPLGFKSNLRHFLLDRLGDRGGPTRMLRLSFLIYIRKTFILLYYTF
jgi:hypothetical protein